MAACESCRSQTRTLVRAALRAGAARASSQIKMPLVPLAQASRTNTVRHFTATSRRSFLGMGNLTDSYRVVGATDRIFKLFSLQADYYITKEERKRDEIERLEDGEEVGHSFEPNPWHEKFGLRPTFSTWSHVTMLHLFLVNTRIRCFDSDEYRRWQQQLIDHFFFECEKKMHVEHGISSSALRQRYLKDIFVQWRGLVLAYDEGLVKGDATLASAVWRNLYKGSPDADPRHLAAVVGWMRWALAVLEATPDSLFSTEVDKILTRSADSFWKPVESLPKQTQNAEAAKRPAALPNAAAAQEAEARTA